MCNYSAMVERHGIERGLQRGLQIGKILAHYEDGILPENIAKKMGMSLQQIEDILVQNNVIKKSEESAN